MDTIRNLKTRRSIRIFEDKEIPVDVLRKIIETAEYAPSSKNSKPWEYFVLTGHEKEDICNMVVEEYPKRGQPYRKREEVQVSGQAITTKNIEDFRDVKVMTNVGSTTFIRQAPVFILVFNKAPYTAGEENVINEISKEALLAHTIEIEGCSAFIFSLLLAAHELGLGGCWIADVNFCRDKIKDYIGTKNDLVAGVVLGYTKVTPLPKQINVKEIEYFKKYD